MRWNQPGKWIAGAIAAVAFWTAVKIFRRRPIAADELDRIRRHGL